MITWVNPLLCYPPHKVARPEQVCTLANEFVKNGWDPSKPALVGYHWGTKIQLLSGSHRWEGAMVSELPTIPVVIKSFAEVSEAWGDLDKWLGLMATPEAGTETKHVV